MHYGEPDGTNISLLIDDHPYSLGPFLGNRNSPGAARTFKCPSDRSATRLFARTGPRMHSRVRSVSLNAQVGTRDVYTGLMGFEKRTDLLRISNIRPDIFVFIDEHADTIAAPNFAISSAISAQYFVNLPSSRHGSSGTLSFMDGRAELHRWLEASTQPPEIGTQWSGAGNVFPSRDWLWLRQRFSKGTAAFGDP
ncbi:MAG: hypothetical protein KF791_01315 [Verrucomicrobiae bacterium]|nr:hypothetical protein [Verrucomicrobiae bacterium]